MFTEANAGLQSLKVLSEFLKANKSLRNYCELESAVSDVYAKLHSANEKLASTNERILELQQRNTALEAKIEEYEKEKLSKSEFESEIRKYQIHTFASGMMAYTIRQECTESIDDFDYVCKKCADNGKLSKLKPTLIKKIIVCQNCSDNVWIER
jgi:cell division protein FtsB